MLSHKAPYEDGHSFRYAYRHIGFAGQSLTI